jgi:AmmeMemoRadiSam system protein B
MTLTGIDYPRLRPVDIRPFAQNGRQFYLLHDPLQLCAQTLVVPQPLHLVLPLCDGTRSDARALGASLAVRFGVQIPPSAIEQLLQALDEACLLENKTYFAACTRALDDYRRAAYRPPASAGLSYPEDPTELEELLNGYLDAFPASTARFSGEIRGLVSPHIDYARGGPIYAQVWQDTEDAVRNAELVLILGTDHNGSAGSLTLTRQHYATPYGVLPTAVDVVDRLSDALNPAACFTEELHHRTEHSIELAAVWLHHMRGGDPCLLVPILCGSFHRYVQADEDGMLDAAADARLGQALQLLQEASQDRKTLIVAAADLAHVGPAFGGRSLDMVGRAQVQSADEALLAQVCAGNAEGFLNEIRQVEDRYNVCGIPPIYLALRLLEPVLGNLVAYDLCPADERGTSQVSACGVILHS